MSFFRIAVPTVFFGSAAIFGCSSSSSGGGSAAVATDAGADAKTVTDAAGDVASDAPVASKGTVCVIADTGGLDDKSFNQTAYAGAKAAQAQYGWDNLAKESKAEADYEPNISAFLGGKCTLIVTVGFNLETATKNLATKNPTQKFQILDDAFDPPISNVWGQVYATDQPSFLAGYIAAGTSKTGKVATFGGMKIPPVTNFMDGFALGVEYYNKQNSATVQVLGWDPKGQSGTFTDDFVDRSKGEKLANDFLAQGADVILPVAGGVGLGAADAVKLKGGAFVIGVDADWTVRNPEYKDIVLTSIVKKLDLSVLAAIKAVADGTFKGGTVSSDLASGQSDIVAPTLAAVPDKVKADLPAIRDGIIKGTIPTKP